MSRPSAAFSYPQTYPEDKQFLWAIAVLSVGLSVGLFDALATAATTQFLLLGTVLIVLARGQELVLSRRGNRLPGTELSPRKRS